MGMQKYRADVSFPQPDGSIQWVAEWMGGSTLSKIEKCVWKDMEGDPRVNVYVTGEPDTVFSIPAVCSYKGCAVRGYLSIGDGDDNPVVFRHTYY